MANPSTKGHMVLGKQGALQKYCHSFMLHIDIICFLQMHDYLTLILKQYARPEQYARLSKEIKSQTAIRKIQIRKRRRGGGLGMELCVLEVGGDGGER